jgi:hypothetical protein
VSSAFAHSRLDKHRDDQINRRCKPAGAWTAEQVVDRMIASVTACNFYILCPDNTVTPNLDKRRLRWSVDDIVENRPDLSRWHKDWRDRANDWLSNPKN